jgi:predicted nucleotide-binding protein
MADAIERKVILDFSYHVQTDNRQEWERFLRKQDVKDLQIALEVWDREWPKEQRKKKILHEELAQSEQQQQDKNDALDRLAKVLSPQSKSQTVATPAEERAEESAEQISEGAPMEPPGSEEALLGSNIFIVHGHDEVAKLTVERLLEKAGLNPIILHKQPNQGRTIIEKFEKNSALSGFAIVLLTPDDEGKPKGHDKWKARARQNVVAELFYFIGRFGRDRVCPLKKGELEIPSDIAGITYIDLDAGEWKAELLRELEAAGYTVDWKNAFN